ncbi:MULTISPECIES: acyl-CoA carboxylase subunit beta [unclassified Candidatus Paralachnospira]|uniref:acyl-CoA carboxylase subunit beta n=1 Tax=unclassified Candidatus Paralachnospira TaxID=3099471 RepID=UPI003F929588
MSNVSTGKASERIAGLLDAQSFVEIGSYVTARSTDFNLPEKETPADGVITGYGTIDGNLVYVYSQDAAVLGGSMGEMHAKKISAVYSLAMKMGAPVIGLIDCAGLRLQEGTDALQAFGGLYMNQVEASGVIPQITAVFGTCGGGMGIVPALTDFTFMEKDHAKLFVNAPNALDGNTAAKCDTASAAYQSESVGSVDATGTEAEIFEEIRNLISVLPANNEDDMSYEECTDDLNRVCADLENCAGDTSIALSMISDDNFFFETKRDFAKEMVTGFIRLNGNTVGAVANRSELVDEDGNTSETFDGVLTAAGCEKAAKFVEFCDAFSIPVLTLTNVKGYKADKHQERKIAKAVASMTYAFANATVPKVNVLVGAAYGSAYVAMNSKSIGADLVFAWPQASVGMMDAKSAARIIYADELAKAENSAALLNEKTRAYAELQSSALSAAKRGYVDNIIDAQDTRKYVIGAFEMLYTKREERPAKKHGTV